MKIEFPLPTFQFDRESSSFEVWFRHPDYFVRTKKYQIYIHHAIQKALNAHIPRNIKSAEYTYIMQYKKIWTHTPCNTKSAEFIYFTQYKNCCLGYLPAFDKILEFLRGWNFVLFYKTLSSDDNWTDKQLFDNDCGKMWLRLEQEQLEFFNKFYSIIESTKASAINIVSGFRNIINKSRRKVW